MDEQDFTPEACWRSIIGSPVIKTLDRELRAHEAALDQKVDGLRRKLIQALADRGIEAGAYVVDGDMHFRIRTVDAVRLDDDGIWFPEIFAARVYGKASDGRIQVGKLRRLFTNEKWRLFDDRQDRLPDLR